MGYPSHVADRRSANSSTNLLFPLPRLCFPIKPSFRRARQRYGESMCATTLVNHAVGALNPLYSCSSVLPASNSSIGLSDINVLSGQRRVLANMYGVSKKFVRASKLSARTTRSVDGQVRSAVSDGSCVSSDCMPVHSVLMSFLSESRMNPVGHTNLPMPPLLGGESVSPPLPPNEVLPSYFGEDPLLSAIPIVASRVSLPSRLSTVLVTSLLPSSLAAEYGHFNSNLLAAVTDSPFQLRRPRFFGEQTEYIKLLCRMKQLNMISFTVAPKAVNGLFGVPKDGDGIRLIIDATPANRLFIPCPHVQLPDPGTLARLSVTTDLHSQRRGALYMAKADLESFYHQLMLPEWLQPYFSLPGIAVEVLVAAGLISSGGAVEDREALMYPMCTTLPMGWSHSVFVSQSVHEYVLYVVGGLNPLHNVMHLRSPFITCGVHLIYVDDFGVLANSRSECDHILSIAVNAYSTAGLMLKLSKLRSSSKEPIQLLGMCISGENYSITLPPDRLRRLVMLTIDTLRAPLVSGVHVQRLVGLWVWQLLLARPALAVLQNAYRFMNTAGTEERVLWSSVRGEFITLLSILPLLRVSLLSGWHRRLIATDASEVAAGVVATSLTSPLFQLFWPLSASRHTAHDHINRVGAHRVVAVGRSFSIPVPTIESGLFQPSVSLLRIHSSAPRLRELSSADYYWGTITSIRNEWRTLISSTWRWKEHINTLELRAIVLALRRVLSSPSSHNGSGGCRLMLLCDSAVVTYAMLKGRSSSPALVNGMKQMAALLLSSGIRLGIVWIPTEINPADAPSRAVNEFIHS